MQRFLFSLLVFSLFAPESAAQDVRFIRPQEDAVVDPPFEVRIEATGVVLLPAGVDEPDAAHVHILVDRELTPEGEIIPAADGIIHLGDGSRETRISELSPGMHTLIAVLGDQAHVRIPGAGTDTVRVSVMPDP